MAHEDKPVAEAFKPREEVIQFLETGLDRVAKLTGRPKSNRMIEEIRLGTPAGRQLYEDILPLYDGGYRGR